MKKLMVKKYMRALRVQMQSLLIQCRLTTYQTAKTLTKMDKLKILQWNCRGLNNKMNDLILFLAENDIDIICVNEVKKWQKTTLFVIMLLQQKLIPTVIMALLF